MNNIDTLREHLFATLQELRNKEKPMELDRAKAIADVAQVVINSAKVEVEQMKISGGTGSGFIPDRPALPGAGNGTNVKRIKADAA